LVSLIALGHWFYDSGLLFGIFEPEHVFVSERARWPFVNSNHLGHFLLPLFFLSLGSLILQFHSFYESRMGGPPLMRILPQLLAEKSQSKIAALCFYLFLPLVFCLAILASLSRSSWFGFAIGLLIFTFFTPRAKGKSETVAPTKHRKYADHFSLHPLGFRIAHRSFKIVAHSLIKPFSVIAAMILIYFFISGRGADLVEGRIEYGLLYSLDDMRWKLFENSLPMIKEHLLWGVGPGQWRHLFPRYMDSLLAGVNPVYLHSDPLQLLAESGLLGTLLIIVTCILFIGRAFTHSASLSFRDKVLKTSLISGLISLGIASWFDFPFRIPAILSCAAALLALTAFYQEGLQGK